MKFKNFSSWAIQNFGWFFYAIKTRFKIVLYVDCAPHLKNGAKIARLERDFLADFCVFSRPFFGGFPPFFGVFDRLKIF